MQIVAVVIAGLYLWMIYFFRRQAAATLESVARLRLPEWKSTDGDKRSENLFLGFAMGFTALALGGALAKMAVAFGIAPRPAEWMGILAVLAIGAAIMIVWMAKIGALKLIGTVTLSKETTDALIRIKTIDIAAMALLIVPPVTVYSGENPVRDTVMLFLAAGVAATLAVIFAFQTAIVFKRQKVSILVWFLYLCIVEIFPVALIVLAVVRNV